MIKALVFDVDGTITESCQLIKDETAEILNRIDAEIAFVSGTHVKELKRMITSKLNRRHHLLGNTGTHYIIVENENERELIKEELSSNQKKEIISALKKLKEEYNLVPLTNEEDQIQDRGSQITFSILGRNAPSKLKEDYDMDRGKRRVFIKYLEEIIDKNKYDMKIGGTTSIDINVGRNDKENALEQFMKINYFKAEEILFFGDQLQPGGNDYAAIKTGARCIAVKNPEETIQFLKNYKTI